MDISEDTTVANRGHLSRLFGDIALVSYIPVRARLRIYDVESWGPFSPFRASFFMSHLTDGGGGRGRHEREDNERRKERKDKKESESQERREYRVQDGWDEAQNQREAGYRLAVELDDASVLEYVALGFSSSSANASCYLLLFGSWRPGPLSPDQATVYKQAPLVQSCWDSSWSPARSIVNWPVAK